MNTQTVSPRRASERVCICSPKRRADQLRVNPYCKARHAGDAPPCDKIDNALISARLVVARVEAAKQSHRLCERAEADLYLQSAADELDRLRAAIAAAVDEVRA